MIIFHVVFWAFAVVDPDLFRQAVGDVGLVDDGIALVFFVGQNGLDGGIAPFFFSAGGFYPFFFQQPDDIAEAAACEELLVDKSNYSGFFGNDLRLAVSTSSVAEEIAVIEGHLTFFCTLGFAPFYVGTDIFRLALGDRAVDGDVELRTVLAAVDTLFLKVHIHTKVFQHSGIFEAIDGVSGKSGNGLADDHVDLALLTQADHFVEFFTLFDTGAGYSSISRCQVRTKRF